MFHPVNNYHIFNNTSIPSFMIQFKAPYVKGWECINKSLFERNESQNLSLGQKVITFVTGCGLLIPLLSRIIYIGLSIFNAQKAVPKQSSSRGQISVVKPESSGRIVTSFKMKSLRQVDEAIDFIRNELSKISDGNLSICIYKSINAMQSLIHELIEEKLDLVLSQDIFMQAEMELNCINDELNYLISELRANPQLISSLPSDEVMNWQKEIRSALFVSRHRKDVDPTFLKLFEAGKKSGFLNIQSPVFFGGSLLHDAAKKEMQNNSLSLIIQAGIDLGIKDYWGNSALIWAIANACNGNAMQILKTLEDSSYLNEQCTKYGNTALHLAVGKGYKDQSLDGVKLPYSNLDLVQVMIDLKANVNLKNWGGNTPLHMACMRRDIQMIEVLLVAGADSSCRNHKGQIPQDLLLIGYDEACKQVKSTVTAFLLDKNEYESSLDKAQSLFQS